MNRYLKAPIFISCLAASLLTAGVGSESKRDYAYINSADSAYTGSRAPAALTMHSTRAFTLALFKNESLGKTTENYGRAKPTQNLHGLLIQQQYILNTATPNVRHDSLQRSTTDSCQHAGTVNVDENFNLTTSLSSVSFNFFACSQNSSSQFDGKMALTVDAFDARSDSSDFTISITNLSIIEGTHRNSYTGTIHALETDNTVTTTSNLHSFDHSNNTQHYLQNLTQVDAITDSISGRVYNGNYGYIDLSSSSNLVMNYANLPSQGYIYLHSTNTSTARISQPSESIVLMELDEDGDGTYEQQEILGITS